MSNDLCSALSCAERKPSQLRVRLSLFVLFLVLLSGVTTWSLAPSHTHNTARAAGPVSGFVTRSGSRLILNGNTFRFSGANIYWYGAVDWYKGEGSCASVNQYVGMCSYTSHNRIDEALTELIEMGGTVARTSESFDSFDPQCSVCLRTTVNSYNPYTFQDLDYAVEQAHNRGIRLIVTLMDNWNYWQGGNPTDWQFPGSGSFYDDPTIRQNFKNYVSTLLNHPNYYTGIQYKNDPAIMAWELGNELVGEPASWAQDISSYIKANDPNHLVADGGCVNNDYCQSASVSNNLAISTIDMYTDHFYRPSYSTLAPDAATVTNAGKVYYVGEYDWLNIDFSGVTLSQMFSDIQNNPNVSGDMYWSLDAHGNDEGAVHPSNYNNCGAEFGTCLQLTYPEYTSDRQNRVQQIRNHAFAMQGLSTPTDSPPGAAIVDAVVNGKVYWRGAPLALNYDVERSTTGPNSGFSVICSRCINDTQIPYVDSSKPSGPVWYRVRAYNRVGVAGPYSNAYLATYTIDDNNSSIQYNGSGWQSLTNRSWDYGGESMVTGNSGDTMQYTFSGTGVSIIGEHNPYAGTATVSIDGAPQQTTVNAYKTGGDINQYPIFSIVGLPYGQHTLVLNKTGSGAIDVDAITIQGGDASNETVVNDTDPNISYSGNWGAVSNAGRGDYNNDFHVSNTIGDSFTYRFTGTGISMLTEEFCDEGTIDIYIDGAKQATVNPYINCGPRYAQQVIYSVSNLLLGVHSFKAVHTGGSYMLFDALTVQIASLITDDTDGAITYSGSGWGAQSNLHRGDWADSIHVTGNNGDSASYTFTGANVSFITEKYSDEGTIAVSIDGQQVQTVNPYNGDGNRYAGQAIASVNGLPYGQHTIRVTKAGGSYMLLDAFAVS